MTEARPAGALSAARRLVVKIGSSLLVNEQSGRVKRQWLAGLAADIAWLRAGGVDVTVVSSGAIAVGRRILGLDAARPKLEEKQAAAATGQIQLAHAYQEALSQHDLTVAQVLLTTEDTERRRRHLNARSTIETLLRLGAIPVINENDTVATEEIRFGDNDRLAARVAQMISADTLVLLSDIDGLYTADPRRDSGAALVPEIRTLTAEIEAMAGAAPPGYSSGGMISKLQAAKIAMAAGCRMAIAQGAGERPLAALDSGARASWFEPSSEPRTARKRWIASTVNHAGAIIVDDGAIAALKAGKSLLPAGVTGVEGSFVRGDAVTVKSAQGARLGSGLIAYSADDARRICGHKSRDIEELLGYRGRQEMIHRDDLVLEQEL